MVADNRGASKSASGKELDISGAATFDYARFFTDMRDSQRVQLARHEVAWHEVHRPPDRTADVVLNLSCGVQTIPHLMLLQVALFERLGVDFVATAGPAYCCGRIFQRYRTKAGIGDRMAATSLQRFASWRPTVNVQCCSSCFIEFDYHVTAMREQTGSAPFEVVHITQFLRDTLRRLGERVAWRRRTPLRVLLHSEGAEVHVSKADQRDAVIDTLALIPGVEYLGPVDPPALGSPCDTTTPGGPSVLAELTPAQYCAVQRDLAEQARRAGADLILTHHHMCQREWSKFSSDRLPVVHYQALLAEALGIGMPDRFQALWRLGDPATILDRTRDYWQSWGIDETAARRLVDKFFVPRYAAAVQRCPCEGTCFAATSRQPATGDA